MKLRTVKRWHEKGTVFLFYIQEWQDDSSFGIEDWVDRSGPYETKEEARHIVTDVILNNKSVYGTELVVEEF